MKSIIKLSPQPYRLLFNAIAVVSLIPGFFIAKTLVTNSHSTPSTLLFYLGIVMAVAGLLIVLFALKNYDILEFTGLGKANPNEKLRITGLNRYVRHPLYTGVFLVVWGIFIATMQMKFLIIAVVTTIYIYIGTKLEERKLLEVFGEDYVRYKEKIGMFFPRRN